MENQEFVAVFGEDMLTNRSDLLFFLQSLNCIEKSFQILDEPGEYADYTWIDLLINRSTIDEC